MSSSRILFRIDSHSSLVSSLCVLFFQFCFSVGFNFDAEIGKARSNLGLRFTSFCPIMAVAENAGVKVDSSAAQNLDKNNNTVEANSENR